MRGLVYIFAIERYYFYADNMLHLFNVGTQKKNLEELIT